MSLVGGAEFGTKRAHRIDERGEGAVRGDQIVVGQAAIASWVCSRAA